MSNTATDFPKSPLALGSTLGVIGGGQLGKMFVQAAQTLGFKTVVLEPSDNSCAGAVAHQHIQATYTDPQGLAQLAAACDAITTEFENVPADSLRVLGQIRPVHPDFRAVSVAQDRALEKQLFTASGIACAPYAVIASSADAQNAKPSLFPAILKTATLGYDGKGQVTVNAAADLPTAWANLGGVRCVLEQKLALAYEISVIVARGADGTLANLPVQQNLHRGGILAFTQVPAPDVSAELGAQAIAAARAIAVQLAYVGVLCVEFFVLTDGALVVNEIAPRPHNSGHYSIEACDVSQYDLQVRTLAGLPLTQPRLMQAAVMINLMGDLWFDAQGRAREPNWGAVLSLSGAALHLYGKLDAKPARKMGHITVIADTFIQAKSQAALCCAALGIHPL